MVEKEFQKSYKKLKSRIDTIKKHFDFKPGISGVTSLQNDKVSSVLLLCHAEIESYFEEMAEALVCEGKDEWKKKRIANYNIASLFITSSVDKSQTTITKSEKIISDYLKSVQTNHGIREHNIKTLFEPLGYELDDFDTAFLSTLDSFGIERGKVAHTSAKKISSVYDKKTEYERIDRIISGIEDFQKVLLLKKKV